MINSSNATKYSNVATFEYIIIHPNALEGKTLIWTFDMEKADGTPIYWLGNSLGGLLLALKQSSSLVIINNAMDAKNELEHFVTLKGLPLSKIAATQILKDIHNLMSEEAKGGIGAISPPIDDNLKTSIGGGILHFQSILSSELPQLNVFFVNPHRAYDMTMLITQGENLLSPKTLDMLGTSKQEVINDIREAAKSLAFDLSTAVGFHIYRAIEAIIVDDYFQILNVLLNKYEKSKNLGSYIKILEDNKVDVKITSMLKHLKDHYRNPIMHPEEFWDTDKANSAIGPAISLIDVMVQNIDEIRKKAP
jgi:hypothetical protein